MATIAYREFYNSKRAMKETPMDPTVIALHGVTEPNQYHSCYLHELFEHMEEHLRPSEIKSLLPRTDKRKATQAVWNARSAGRDKLAGWDDV